MPSINTSFGKSSYGNVSLYNRGSSTSMAPFAVNISMSSSFVIKNAKKSSVVHHATFFDVNVSNTILCYRPLYWKNTICTIDFSSIYCIQSPLISLFIAISPLFQKKCPEEANGSGLIRLKQQKIVSQHKNKFFIDTAQFP